jgi:hypothetical protein
MYIHINYICTYTHIYIHTYSSYIHVSCIYHQKVYLWMYIYIFIWAPKRMFPVFPHISGTVFPLIFPAVKIQRRPDPTSVRWHRGSARASRRRCRTSLWHVPRRWTADPKKWNSWFFFPKGTGDPHLGDQQKMRKKLAFTVTVYEKLFLVA